MYATRIKLSEAKAGMKLAESVYFPTNTGQFMLAARKFAVLDEGILKSFTRYGILEMDVFTSVPPNVKERITEKKAPVKTVIEEKLKGEAVENVKELFGSISPDGSMNKTTAYQSVKNIEGVVSDLLNVINNEQDEIFHIYDLKAHDEYTYHHSLSVAVLSMATGHELGLDDATVLRLGNAAMLHDIGKQMIPLDIINKKGRLTDEEFAIIKNHPSKGADSLKDNGVGNRELWDGIRYHHEKINGTGYPNNLKGNDIPLFAKIIAVADVYDAITSYRSYRSPMQPLEAFDVIFKDINVAFDYKVIKAFYAKLEFYPINSIVELSNGKIAIVVQGSNWKLRPVVRIWGTDEVMMLSSSQHKDISIVRLLSAAELPEGYEFV